ncbi:hypothetical protein RND81_09G232900 [Saponaria officinalis]|uniref:NAC domain-containing protein n=1 Tax=Saponaria officinalis TaxID=3572 RepID=A0AAW1IQK0_SAPOF
MCLIVLFQLDDWVLCRIYNKKGTIEKGYNPNVIDHKPTPHDFEYEDQKPVISTRGLNAPVQFTVPPKNDLLHFDTSDSVPHCHTDTSGSALVASPEFEVQSEAKWNEVDRSLELPFNYMDTFPDDPLFANPTQFQHDQMSSLQDIFMLLR